MSAVYGSRKSNQLAIVVETTAGTPVDPSAVTDYLALQNDFKMTPNFNVLENAEIKASIGIAKPIQGLESPQGSFSHYLKHSGTEGTPPEFDILLKSVFGAQNNNGTERTITSSSTVSDIKLGAGGSDFARGYAVLVKDGTNGYSIRPILSVSTNDLTPAFNLANAPASGVKVGKCVNFSPANTGHPSFTLHSYEGSGQSYEAMAGCKVSKFSFTASAGDLINANFSFSGTKFYFDPITITSTTKYIDFLDGSTDYNVSVTAQKYRDPHELAQAIQDAMNAAGASSTFTVTYQDDDFNNGGTHSGMMKFLSNGSTFSLKWNTGTNTANSIASKIGFSTAANSTGALSYYGTALSWASGYTPSLDSSDPLPAKNNEVMLGDAVDYTCFCAQSISFSLDDTVTDVKCICAESGVDSKLVTKRAVNVQISALLNKNDVQKFKRYRSNASVQFAFNFGTKSGGNWVAGSCGCLFLPTAVISAFEETDLESLIGIQMTLTAYVDSSGNGEVYLNFL
jgi:hypothetical protein